jgi:hypothetical protein
MPVTCPPGFVYTSNGKDIEISFLVDAIHGLKFYSSDDGRTAALITGVPKPAFAPFDISKAGSVASLGVQIGDPLTADIETDLILKIEIPPNVAKGSDQGALVTAYNRLMEEVTGLSSSGETGPRKEHKGVSFHVTWTVKATNTLLMEHDVTADMYYMKYSNDEIMVDKMRLPIGDYLITAKTLSDNPQFRGVSMTELFIGRRHIDPEIPLKDASEQK